MSQNIVIPKRLLDELLRYSIAYQAEMINKGFFERAEVISSTVRMAKQKPSVPLSDAVEIATGATAYRKALKLLRDYVTIPNEEWRRHRVEFLLKHTLRAKRPKPRTSTK